MVETLADLVTDPQRGGPIVSPPLKRLLRRKLANGQVVLLLDALDELPNELYDTLIGWLRAWVRDHPPRRLYLTSRLVGYRGLPPDLMAAGAPGAARAELELVAFTPVEIHQYISAYFGDAIDPATSHRLADELWWHLEQNPPMLGLAQTPLLLTLICLAFAHAGQGRKLQLPVTRCELYAECLEGLLGRWPHVRREGWESGLTQKEEDELPLKRDLLAEIAWQLSGSDPEKTLFTRFEIKQSLRGQPCSAVLQELGWTSGRALEELTQVHGLLIRTGIGSDSRYLFLHRTFQEYLLAWALARRPDWLELARQRLYDLAWLEVLSLLALSFTHISLLTEVLTVINLAAIFNNTVHLFELSNELNENTITV